MRLTARQAMQLVGVTTPVAGTAEVHEMKMEGDVMRMRPVAKLDLPAGQDRGTQARRLPPHADGPEAAAEAGQPRCR